MKSACILIRWRLVAGEPESLHPAPKRRRRNVSHRSGVFTVLDLPPYPSIHRLRDESEQSSVNHGSHPLHHHVPAPPTPDDAFPDPLPQHQVEGRQRPFTEVPTQGRGVAWLPQQFHQLRETIKILEVGEDGSVTILIPHYNINTSQVGIHAVPATEKKQPARRCPFSLARIKLVHFRDTSEFINVCNNFGCDRRDDADPDLYLRNFNLCDLHNTDYTTLFGDCAPLCRCARTALAEMFGAVGDASMSFDQVDDTGDTFASWAVENQQPRRAPFHVACAARRIW